MVVLVIRGMEKSFAHRAGRAMTGKLDIGRD
jgi:hypothetical protein